MAGVARELYILCLPAVPGDDLNPGEGLKMFFDLLGEEVKKDRM